MDKEKKEQSSARINEDSVLFNQIVPFMLIGMSVVMAVLIVLALGVLLGIVPFK